jgi:hypothetical protein
MGFSQLFINKSKNDIKKAIGKPYIGKESIAAIITETDSSLTMKIRGKGATEADHIYSFDKSGNCSSVKTITWYDSCHEKLLQLVLAAKKYRWKKINLNQYLAKYSAGVFVEIQFSGDARSFTINRVNLTRKMYRLILENK